MEGDIDRPNKAVVDKLKTFHSWDRTKQIELLQFLKKWFENPDTADAQLSSEARAWVGEMHADKELQRSLKVWLSRYCYDTDKTIREISSDVISAPHRLKQ